MTRTARVGAITLALILLSVIALPFLVDPNEFRPMLESQLSQALGRDVKVGGLKLALLEGGISGEDLSIAGDPAYSLAPLLYARSMTVRVDLWQLIRARQLRVTQLTLVRPQIELVESATGEWNFSSVSAKRSSTPPPAAGHGSTVHLSVNRVNVVDGRLTFAQRGSNAKSRALDHLSAEAGDFSSGSVFPFHMAAKLGGDGDIRLDGTAGPINADDAAQTPVKVQVKLSGVDLAAAEVESLAGLLSMNGRAAWNGRAFTLNGRLKAERWRVAKNGSSAQEPVEFEFALEHDMRKGSGMLRRGELHAGEASAQLTGTYAAQRESVTINLSFFGERMPVPQLAALLPGLGVTLPAGSSFEGGTATARLTLTGTVDAPAVEGFLAVDNTRLAGFDLGSKMSGIEKLAGVRKGPDTEIRTLAVSVSMTPEGMAIRDIRLVAPAIGELSGGGTVSPSQTLDFKMRARLDTGGVAMTVLGAKGGAGVPFLIEGTAAHPIFRPDVKGYMTEKARRIEKLEFLKQ